MIVKMMLTAYCGQCYLSLVQPLRPIADHALSRSRGQSNHSHRRRLRPRSTRLIRLVGLVEQEVCSQLLVLIEGEVGLDDHLTFESQTTQLLLMLANEHAMAMSNGLNSPSQSPHAPPRSPEPDACPVATQHHRLHPQQEAA